MLRSLHNYDNYAIIMTMSNKATTKRAKRTKKLHIHPAPIVGVIVTASIFGLFNAQLISAYATRLTQQPHSGPVKIEQIIPTDKTAAEKKVPLEPIVTMPSAGITAPVVYDMESTLDADVQRALENGVLHFGDSALPGERGNAVFVGHSSGQPWAPGDYKFVFTMLDRLQPGHQVQLNHGTERYIYEVTEKVIVDPIDVSVLEQTDGATATFITCWPVGMNAQRLVVKAKLVSHEAQAPQETNARNAAPELQSGLPGSAYSALEALQERL